ncbi:glycosyltransferase family 39 protein [bacterium]|nr:glycosyltransferase family 39 protein [bacterium]MBU3956370.1 glycosyltransferase family 39 protein [bacterium]
MFRREIKIPANVIFFLLFSVSYCILPVWYVEPVSVFDRWLLFNGFLAVSLWLLFQKKLWDKNISFSFPHSFSYFLPLIASTAALHLFFWHLPVPTGGDYQSHAGPAAVAIAKVAEFINIPVLRIILWLGVVALFTSFMLKQKKKDISLDFTMRYKKIIILVIFFMGNIYFALINYYKVVSYLGMWETILRYPPVGKIIYLTGFIFFGIHEAVPRIIQFAFLTVAAVFLIKTMEMFYRAVPGKIIFILFLLFPSFFHFANYSLLTCGVVFFYSAASYYFLKASETNDEKYLVKLALVLSVGMLYKRLLLGFIPVAFFYLLIFPHGREFNKNAAFYFALSLICGFPFTILSGLLHVRDAAVSFSPQFFVNMKLLLATIGPVLFLAVVAGFFWDLKSGFSRSSAFFCILFAAYYVMISQTGANGYIRHAQPFYLPVFYFIAVFLCRFRAADKKRIFPLVSVVLIAASVYFSFFQRNPTQRKSVFNRYEDVYPYEELSLYLQALPQKNIKIYAPMETEPANFYLAKHNLFGKISWDRTSSYNIDGEYILNKAAQYDYLCLAETGKYENVIRDILKTVPPEKVFDFYGNKIYLFKKQFK